MGILRTDRVSGLGGANAIKGSVFFGNNIDSTGGATGNDYLITERSDNFTFGTGDITIEGWFFCPRLSSSTDYQALVGDTIYSGTGGFTFYIEDGQLNFWKGTSASSVVSGGTIVQNEWTHLAYTRESGSNKIFVNGSLVGTASDSTDYTDTALTIGTNKVTQTSGSDAGQFPFHGFASNVRVLKGRALYTAAFTPPVGELQVIDNTVLLCCQSPGNVLQEATGVVLTAPTINNSIGAQASHFTPNSPVIGTTSGFSTTTDVGTQFGSTFGGVTTFDSQAYFVPPGGNTRERNRGRGLIFGGYSPSPAAHVNTIQFINIQSFGNAQDFGDLTSIRSQLGAVSSKTRAISCGGGNDTPADYSNVNTCEFVTIATTSNTTDFGDLTVSRTPYKASSNDTRGIIFGGYAHPSNLNTIDFITMATAGNATDFGDEIDTNRAGGSCSSTTRGIVAGGFPYTNRISFVEFATTGNSQDFGDLLNSVYGTAGVSNNTRGVFGGGGNSPNAAAINVIQFITMASTGDATDFGDLNTTEKVGSKGNSNSIRGIFSGGYDGATFVNSISAITIATTGDAVDFGDISGTLRFASGTSDSHGGLE